MYIKINQILSVLAIVLVAICIFMPGLTQGEGDYKHNASVEEISSGLTLYTVALTLFAGWAFAVNEKKNLRVIAMCALSVFAFIAFMVLVMQHTDSDAKLSHGIATWIELVAALVSAGAAYTVKADI